MTGALSYKGYHAAVAFDADDAILTGRIAGINDVIGFHAEDARGLVAAFHEAVDDYLETCAKLGKPPERTYSGRVMVRIKPDIHARAALAAQLAGISLNQFSEEALGALAERRLAGAG